MDAALTGEETRNSHLHSDVQGPDEEVPTRRQTDEHITTMVQLLCHGDSFKGMVEESRVVTSEAALSTLVPLGEVLGRVAVRYACRVTPFRWACWN